MKTLIPILILSIVMNSLLVCGQEVKNEKEIASDSTLKERARIRKHYLQLEDPDKLKKITIIKQEYKVELDKLLADSSEVFEKKRAKIERLMDKKNLEASKVLSQEEFRLFLEAEPRLTPARNYTSIDGRKKP